MVSALIASAMLMLTTPAPVEPINASIVSDTAFEACNVYGEQYDISPELLMAIIETESEGKPNAKNGSCKGLMQVSTRWHSDRMKKLGVTDIYDEAGNILVGTDYLAELFEEYEDPGTVLMVYNGDRRAKSYKNGNCRLSKYAREILERAEELERAHGK